MPIFFLRRPMDPFAAHCSTSIIEQQYKQHNTQHTTHNTYAHTTIIIHTTTSIIMPIDAKQVTDYLEKKYLADLGIKLKPENFIQQALESSGSTGELAQKFWKERISTNPVLLREFKTFTASARQAMPAGNADQSSSTSPSTDKEEEEEEQDTDDDDGKDELDPIFAQLRIQSAKVAVMIQRMRRTQTHQQQQSQANMQDDASTSLLGGNATIDQLIAYVREQRTKLETYKNPQEYSEQLKEAITFERQITNAN
jgi:hypothetical protein